MKKGGFRIVNEGHPIALFTAARDRTTIHDGDRIYGIMQVFSYSPSTSRDPSRSFTAADLTDELVEALLQDHPTQGQLHAFIEPADTGRAWQINQKSLIPPAYVNYQPAEGYRG